MIISTIIDMVRGWPGGLQFLFVISIATMGTFVLLVVFGAIAEFITKTIPVLFRGYPPEKKKDMVDS